MLMSVRAFCADHKPVDAIRLLESDGNVTVTVAIPGAGESELLISTSLYKNGIQPVWIEVVNQGDKDYVLLKTDVDQDQFSPLEAFYQRHSGDQDTELAMDRFFTTYLHGGIITPPRKLVSASSGWRL